MKRLFLILIFIPSLAFGAYTEFYCQSGGSNLNAGSTTNNTALYTATNGGWNSSTLVYTPTDGSNPVSAGVTTGMFASVYNDGASVGVWVGRVTAVTNATNGTITVAAAPTGTVASTNASARTIKVGGAWLGPNAASGFPFTMTSYGNNKDSTSHIARTNLKNDQTYSMTASFAFGAGSQASVIQGYTSTVGDGGRFTMDGGTSTGALVTSVTGSGTTFIDAIFKTSISSGTTDLVSDGGLQSVWIRCVFTGSRGIGLNSTAAGTTVTECEAYGNNTANSVSKSGILLSGGSVYVKRSITHDNAGSNTSGLAIGAGPAVLENCVSDTNGLYGVRITGTSVNGEIKINNCDIYNNASDGINVITAEKNPIWIENSNFIKNGGAAINNVSVVNFGFSYNNGYGAGTQANGSGDTLNNLTTSGAVTYGSNLTPWVDPANGNFGMTPSFASVGAGRGSFQTTASSYGPTVGYPDVGAAFAPTPTATPSATATSTATATATSTATATFTPTATATASFTPCAPTPGPTATATPTMTPTATASATNTPTPTPTAPIQTSYTFGN